MSDPIPTSQGYSAPSSQKYQHTESLSALTDFTRSQPPSSIQQHCRSESSFKPIIGNPRKAYKSGKKIRWQSDPSPRPVVDPFECYYDYSKLKEPLTPVATVSLNEQTATYYRNEPTHPDVTNPYYDQAKLAYRTERETRRYNVDKKYYESKSNQDMESQYRAACREARIREEKKESLCYMTSDDENCGSLDAEKLYLRLRNLCEKENEQ